MLSAVAARLAALEVLCPTAALAGDEAYPTLAGDKVFDSRAVGIDDLDREAKFTPCLALYTESARTAPRGDVAAYDDAEAYCVLEVVAELAIAAAEDNGEQFADAMPADDWHAQIVLAALCAQVRRQLQFAERGYLFRRFVKHVRQISEESFAIPQLGARWCRVTMRFEMAMPDDVFDEAAGLPEPIRTLADLLPQASPARAKLETLAAHFGAITRSPLEGVDFDDLAGTTFAADTE